MKLFLNSELALNCVQILNFRIISRCESHPMAIIHPVDSTEYIRWILSAGYYPLGAHLLDYEPHIKRNAESFDGVCFDQLICGGWEILIENQIVSLNKMLDKIGGILSERHQKVFDDRREHTTFGRNEHFNGVRTQGEGRLRRLRSDFSETLNSSL